MSNITIHNICSYLNIAREELNDWCIVGVHYGREIKDILKTIPM